MKVTHNLLQNEELNDFCLSKKYSSYFSPSNLIGQFSITTLQCFHFVYHHIRLPSQLKIPLPSLQLLLQEN